MGENGANKTSCTSNFLAPAKIVREHDHWNCQENKKESDVVNGDNVSKSAV